MYIILKYVLIKIKIKLHKYMSSCNNLLNIFWCVWGGGKQKYGFALLCQKYIESLKTCPLLPS